MRGMKIDATDQTDSEATVAILVPCFNEEATIASVITGFKRLLPGATVYVYDNNSRDRTAEIAHVSGAVVRSEHRQGKGNVIRRMFSDIDADVYIMVDGDATYDPGIAPTLVAEIATNQLDFVNVRRVETAKDAYRPGHAFGNRMLTSVVSSVFGNHFEDMLSGYKAFSRRFVKSFPAISTGFEIETEIVIHALELRAPSKELAAPYGSRPAGSTSKLNTLRDGWRILRVIGRIILEERPMTVSLTISALLLAAAILLGLPLLISFLKTGLVERIPTAIIVSGLGIGAGLCVITGGILHFVTISRREMKRLFYLKA